MHEYCFKQASLPKVSLLEVGFEGVTNLLSSAIDRHELASRQSFWQLRKFRQYLTLAHFTLHLLGDMVILWQAGEGRGG